MKLNEDCVRNLLCTVESVTTLENEFRYSRHANKIEGYFTKDEVFYHARQCNSSGLFINCKFTITGDLVIDDLSPEGHKILNKTKDPTLWEKIKSHIVEAAISSVPALIEFILKFAG